jgi:antitoxin ParD1/3/4
MTNLTISLSEEMRTFIEEQAASAGYGTVSDYLKALVREEQMRRAQERLEELLLEGLESGPATPMTAEDWDEMRRQYDERHRSANAS